MKLICKYCILLVIFCPSWVFGIGLGPISVHSYLDQPLNADIQLNDLAPSSLNDVQISLADQTAYDDLGAELSPEQTKLKFSLSHDKSGIPIIQVNSVEPIHDPYLRFLLQLKWANRQLVREYTLLLSPPDYQPHSSSSTTVLHDQITARDSTIVTATTEQAVSPSELSQLSTKLASASGQTNVNLSPKTTYGPVRADEDLWQIAKAVRSDPSISIHQVMQSLYQANPTAFTNNDINKLKTGSILTLPNLAKTYSSPQAQNDQVLNSQTMPQSIDNAEDLQNFSHQSSQPTEVSSSSASDPTQLYTPVRSSTVVLNSSAEANEVQPDTQVYSSIVDQLAVLRNDLTIANQTLAIVKQSKEDLNQQMHSLMQENQKLSADFTAQQQEIAVLKQQLAQVIAQQTMTRAHSKPNPNSRAIDISSPIAQPITSSASTVWKLSGVLAVIFLIAGLSIYYKRKDRLTILMVPVASYFLRWIQWVESLLYKTFKKQEKNSFATSHIVGELSSATSAIGEFKPSLQESRLNVEMPPLDQATMSNPEVSEPSSNNKSVMPSQVAPLEEASIYLSYQRYRPAETVLLTALKHQPDNNKYRMKLFEVYAAMGDQVLFRERMLQDKQILQDTDYQLWETILSLQEKTWPTMSSTAIENKN